MASYLLLMDELKGEYKEAFDKVYVYTHIRNMEGNTEEEMMMNLLDMLLTAQNEGKPAAKIVGDDIEKFCESYFEEFDIKTRLTDQLPKRVNFLMCGMFIVVLIELLLSVSEDDFNLFTAKTDLAPFCLGIIGGIVVLVFNKVVMRPLIFKWKRISAVKYDLISIGTFIVMVVVLVAFVEMTEVNISMFAVMLVSALYIVFYNIAKLVKRYKENGSIKKENTASEWMKGINESVEKELPQELVKRFEKINKRRERRGKEFMTPEEYMKKLRKEIGNVKLWEVVGNVSVVLIIVSQIVQIALKETLGTTIVFAVILCIFEIPVFMLLKASNEGSRIRKRILDECEEQGITIIEYVKKDQDEE